MNISFGVRPDVMQMMSRNVVVSGTWHYHVLFVNSLLRRFTQLLVVNHEQFFYENDTQKQA